MRKDFPSIISYDLYKAYDTSTAFQDNILVITKDKAPVSYLSLIGNIFKITEKSVYLELKPLKYKMSNKSFNNFITLEPSLQLIVYALYNFWDLVVLEGHRTIERQKELLKQGRTKTMHSKHLTFPSCAVDIAVYKYLDDVNQLYRLNGTIKLIADTLGVELRWGGDWDMDNDTKDNKFNDLYHYEVVKC